MTSYQDLFGKDDPQDATVTGWAEHGRQGGVSTGVPFKRVQEVDDLTLIDEVDSNTTYIGTAKYGSTGDQAVWRIRRVLVTGTVTEISFADGDDEFDNIWDNRVSLNYS